MLVLVGVNHKTAEIDLREKLHFSTEELPRSLEAVKALPTVSEALILSTCNRVEILAAMNRTPEGPDGPDGIEALKAFLLARPNGRDLDLATRLYVHTEGEAVRHVFRVASSLDSLVVGEPQILGQVKEAFRVAMDAGATGARLNRCMHRAIHVAKRVRTETGIARHPVSVSSVAVDLAEKIFENLADQVVLLVGSGEMMQEVAERLHQSGVREMIVTSRTHAHASALAAKFQGTTFFLEKLPQHLPRADIVISCTASVEPLIHRQPVVDALRIRQSKPLFVIDLSVPRNVEESVGKLANVYLYNIDDLSTIVGDNLKHRAEEMKEAEAIVTEEWDDFSAHLNLRESLPLIASLNEKAEAIGRQELEKTLKRFPELTDEQRQSIEAMSQAIVRKILHVPNNELRRAAEKQEGEESFLASVRRLFRL